MFLHRLRTHAQMPNSGRDQHHKSSSKTVVLSAKLLIKLKAVRWSGFLLRPSSGSLDQVAVDRLVLHTHQLPCSLPCKGLDLRVTRDCCNVIATVVCFKARRVYTTDIHYPSQNIQRQTDHLLSCYPCTSHSRVFPSNVAQSDQFMWHDPGPSRPVKY